MQAVAAAAPFIAIAGAGLSAIGAIRQGNAGSASATYNANLADQNAQLATQQGVENARRARIASAKQLGKARAGYGASGVTVDGSPLDVLEESARSAELDAMSIEHQGALQAWGYQNSANLYRSQAQQARQGGYWGAATALLKGAATAGAMWGMQSGPSDQLLKYRGAANEAYLNPDI